MSGRTRRDDRRSLEPGRQGFDLSSETAVANDHATDPESHSRSHENLFFVGDAARVVEPFTGEGIAYALHSGESRRKSIHRLSPRRECNRSYGRNFVARYAAMYGGRLWINAWRGSAVVSPAIGICPVSNRAVATEVTAGSHIENHALRSSLGSSTTRIYPKGCAQL